MQADGGQENQWNDHEATRHINRPRSGESVASSGRKLSDYPVGVVAACIKYKNERVTIDLFWFFVVLHQS
ncbi:hypothetical protein NDU88_005398 [Pleurodeles waltl]|uniref:Uncharacterized protein n=1 Tax=Pleurodeles waltl TaxID=8319 RepID=A0AAV7NS62_PLEWA|nr:hypothetical protein NDU88_005398 [Pleurodeles waltl]